MEKRRERREIEEGNKKEGGRNRVKTEGRKIQEKKEKKWRNGEKRSTKQQTQ
jgi:hypothetical protein